MARSFNKNDSLNLSIDKNNKKITKNPLFSNIGFLNSKYINRANTA